MKVYEQNSTQIRLYTHGSSHFQCHHLRNNLHPARFRVFPPSSFQGLTKCNTNWEKRLRLFRRGCFFKRKWDVGLLKADGLSKKPVGRGTPLNYISSISQDMVFHRKFCHNLYISNFTMLDM